MAIDSLIGWTDSTWNPLLGCSKCSAGCKFCYAIRTAWRLQHNPNPKIAKAYEGLVEEVKEGVLNWTGRINLVPDRLRQPMGWKKPRRIFVNSQSDLFHPDVPEEFIDQVFTVMAVCRRHTFQVLTKRPERMREYLTKPGRLESIYAQWYGFSGTAPEAEGWPLPNVWLGVSVEDQKSARERIPYLWGVPAVVKFLSCEPLLGPLSLYEALKTCWSMKGGSTAAWHERPASEVKWSVQSLLPMGWQNLVQWVIVGGESGPEARPMHPDWPRYVRDQCIAAGVPFFFKQWGEWRPHDKPPERGVYTGAGRFVRSDGRIGCQGDWWDGTAQAMDKVGKKAAGAELDGREWVEFPEPTS